MRNWTALRHRFAPLYPMTKTRPFMLFILDSVH
jgi:hypothetical protein